MNGASVLRVVVKVTPFKATQQEGSDTHSCLAWDSNPRSEFSSDQGQSPTLDKQSAVSISIQPDYRLSCTLSSELRIELPTVWNFFRTFLFLSFLYGIKWTLIPHGEKTGNSTTWGIFIYLTIILCKIQHLNTRPFFVGSPLLCKIQLVPLVLVPSFVRIRASQIVTMIMNYDVLVLKFL
jgi:hypothetical protein